MFGKTVKRTELRKAIRSVNVYEKVLDKDGKETGELKFVKTKLQVKHYYDWDDEREGFWYDIPEVTEVKSEDYVQPVRIVSK